MSRYRPPRPKSSPYITRQGYDDLKKELSMLWKEKRPEVTQKVSEAAAQGDRSENAEYIYGKRQLREIDQRIRFLAKRLDDLKIVETHPPQTNTVFFGAWVTLINDAGEEIIFRIVGADEFDTDPAYISVDAPLARAMIGKRVDEEVVVEPQRDDSAPRISGLDKSTEVNCYVIDQIRYE